MPLYVSKEYGVLFPCRPAIFLFKIKFAEIFFKVNNFMANKFEMSLESTFFVDYIMLDNIFSLVYLLGSELILTGWYSQF